MLATIKVPVLVVVGEKDDVAGKIGPLLAAIPGSTGVTLPKRNHMNAVGDKQYKVAVLTFLGSHITRRRAGCRSRKRTGRRRPTSSTSPTRRPESRSALLGR
jgi:hypothetical protein